MSRPCYDPVFWRVTARLSGDATIALTLTFVGRDGAGFAFLRGFGGFCFGAISLAMDSNKTTISSIRAMNSLY